MSDLSTRLTLKWVDEELERFMGNQAYAQDLGYIQYKIRATLAETALDASSEWVSVAEQFYKAADYLDSIENPVSATFARMAGDALKAHPQPPGGVVI